MWKNRILLLMVGVVLIAILYRLPKVVVHNEENEVVQDSTQNKGNFHTSEATPKDLKRIAGLKSELKKPENNGKSSIFADSLAEAFRSVNQWDSAAYYLAQQAEENPSDENLIKAGEAYFQAQGFAVDQNEVEKLGSQARVYFDKVLKENPGDLDTKTRKALTYVASSNPMQGIVLLREVLEQDPENELALFNMGILSMQSSQWDKAVERFEKLLEVNPDNSKAHFYLAVSYMQINNDKLAREHFLKVKDLDKDPEVLANVDSYLKELNNK